MREQECWEEVKQLEQAMKTMHDSLERIIAGCSNTDAKPIRYEADAMRRQLVSAFAAKFALVEAINDYFHD